MCCSGGSTKCVCEVLFIKMRKVSLLEDVCCCLLVPVFLALNDAVAVSVYLALLCLTSFRVSFRAGHTALILYSLFSACFTAVFVTQVDFSLVQLCQLVFASLLSTRAILSLDISWLSCGQMALAVQAGSLLLYSVLAELATLYVFAAPIAIGERAAVSCIVRFSVSLLLVFIFALYHLQRYLNCAISARFISIWLILLSLSVVSTCSAVINHNCLLWILKYITASEQKVALLSVWTSLFCVAIATAVACSSSHLKRLSSSPISDRSVLRKLFHFLLAAVYIPGLFADPILLYAASSALLFCLIIAEVVRVAQCGFVSDLINSWYEPFLRGDHSTPLVLCNIYLLVGCSGVLWYTGTAGITPGPVPVPLLSGVISVGIGDAAAACVGVCWGRKRFGSRGRTVEGSLAMLISQLLSCWFLWARGYMSLPGGFSSYLALGIACLISAFWEAWSSLPDNVTLPLIFSVTYSAVMKLSCMI